MSRPVEKLQLRHNFPLASFSLEEIDFRHNIQNLHEKFCEQQPILAGVNRTGERGYANYHFENIRVPRCLWRTKTIDRTCHDGEKLAHRNRGSFIKYHKFNKESVKVLNRVFCLIRGLFETISDLKIPRNPNRNRNACNERKGAGWKLDALTKAEERDTQHA